MIANGDINTIEDVDAALDQSGADGVMIGRGAYGRPWLLKQVMHWLRTGERLPDPSLDEQYRGDRRAISRRCSTITAPQTGVNMRAQAYRLVHQGPARLGRVPQRLQPGSGPQAGESDVARFLWALAGQGGRLSVESTRFCDG